MAGLSAPVGVLDVLVVDDHFAFADAISLAINLEDDLHCMGCVGTVAAALDIVERSCPAIVLLDLGLPDAGGIEAIAPIRRLCPEVRVVVLTADTSVETAIAAIDAGADGFLPKQQPFADVLDAIRSEDSFVADTRTMASVLQAAVRTPERGDERAPVLTDREHEILVLLADTQTVKEIASRLDISVHTCRGHVRAILAKFEAHSQLEAVVRAARLGMLPNLHTSDG